MAPSSAVAEKTQTLKRFGTYGFYLETVTKVIGVPKTDCFVVEDRILVEPAVGGQPHEGLLLTARFGIRFIKYTIFRSIITATTTKEKNAEFKGFDEYVLKNLASFYTQ